MVNGEGDEDEDECGGYEVGDVDGVAIAEQHHEDGQADGRLGRRDRGRPARHPGEPAGRPGVRLEGRDARGLLVVHRAAVQVPRRERRRRGPEHDPRRRR